MLLTSDANVTIPSDPNENYETHTELRFATITAESVPTSDTHRDTKFVCVSCGYPILAFLLFLAAGKIVEIPSEPVDNIFPK